MEKPDKAPVSFPHPAHHILTMGLSSQIAAEDAAKGRGKLYYLVLKRQNCEICKHMDWIF